MCSVITRILFKNRFFEVSTRLMWNERKRFKVVWNWFWSFPLKKQNLLKVFPVRCWRMLKCAKNAVLTDKPVGKHDDEYVSMRFCQGHLIISSTSMASMQKYDFWWKKKTHLKNLINYVRKTNLNCCFYNSNWFPKSIKQLLQICIQ